MKRCLGRLFACALLFLMIASCRWSDRRSSSGSVGPSAPTLTTQPTRTVVVGPATAVGCQTPEPSPSPVVHATATQPTRTPSPTPGPPPRVLASYPIDGDQAVDPDRPLILVFDRPMDRGGVIAHATVSPAVDGRFDWPAPDRLRFAPAKPWQAGLEYRLTLSVGAPDAWGNGLARPFSVGFCVDGRGVPLPVLMYHHVLDLGKDVTVAQRTWTVSPEAFEEQMAYLVVRGWQTISPRQLAAYFSRGEPLPPRALIITIDDGYKEIYTTVYPLVERTELRPTLFIVPEYIGYGAYLNWEQLEELVKAGFEVGAHGYDHSDLRQCSEEELEHQLQDSRDVLSKELSIEIDAFCYPYGSYDDRVLVELGALGYGTAFTLNPTRFQVPDDPYRLGRLRVSYETTLWDFAELLR